MIVSWRQVIIHCLYTYNLKMLQAKCSVTYVQGQSAALPGTVTQRLLLTQGSDPFPSELHSPPSTPASSAAGTLCWETGSSLGSPLLWKSNEYNYHNCSKMRSTIFALFCRSVCNHNNCAVQNLASASSFPPQSSRCV